MQYTLQGIYFSFNELIFFFVNIMFDDVIIEVSRKYKGDLILSVHFYKLIVQIFIVTH